MMNEIVINHDPHVGNTICGTVAHDLYFNGWDQAKAELPQDMDCVFCVFEKVRDKWVLREVQSSFKGAVSYMNPDRVLVYEHAPAPIA